MKKQKPALVYSNLVFFIVSGVLGFVAAPLWGLFFGFSSWTWAVAGIFWVFSGMSITAGYHRLWSHRTYKAAWPLRVFFAVFGAQSLQNSILVWAARHRVHHRYVDDAERDPYSITSGFWHAHMGWMTRHWPTSKIDFDQVRDLQRDPVVMWQHRFYWPLAWFMNLGLPLLLGWLVGDVIGMFLLAGAFRLAFSQHCTFFINSLAHTLGRRRYSLENTARDSGIVALLTWGEGYHNFHHAFQFDYRNGIRWWQFDPGKWVISAAALLGQAHDLRRIPAFKIRRAKLQVLFRELRKDWDGKPESKSWVATLEKEYTQFKETIAQWQAVQAERVAAGKAALNDKWHRTELSTRYRELEYRLKMQARRLVTLRQAAVAV